MDKDKIPIVKHCFDCNKEFYTSSGYDRRVKSDHVWRCSECMKKHRSDIQKSSPTNIANIVADKLSNTETADIYKKSLGERSRMIWANKTDEEKQKQIDALVAGHKEYLSNLSQEERSRIASGLREYYDRRSPEEVLRHNEVLSQSKLKYFHNMTSEEKKSYAEKYKRIWENKSDEDKMKVSQNTIDQWKELSQEERDIRLKTLQEGSQLRWDNMTPEEREILSNNKRESYQNLSQEEKDRIIKIHQQRWIDMSPETKYHLLKKTFVSSNKENKFHKLFEEYFMNSYISNDFFYIEEEVVKNDGVCKSWDYGIHDKQTNSLQLLVDLDGAFFHADNYDYNGIHSREEYDERRSLSIPDGVKTHIIYEHKFKQSFENMIKLLMINYDDFIMNQFKLCRSMPFPFPSYNDHELIKSYKDLEKMNCDSKHINTSTNSRLGDRLITSFHQSIYHACVGKGPSPYDAWYDDELLMKVIKNRIIYVNILNPNKILQGFNICKLAPKVSVFSAGRAKIIINKYLNDMNEIFDPFSGFSGRMLGCISLGKRYIGQDISEIHVKESNDIINFLKSCGVEINGTVNQKDILYSEGEYECLFTCSPYSNKESWLNVPIDKRSCDDWIDECLKRFKCKRYVFIVDKTERYNDYIVDEIINKSHFGSNHEYVILINGGIKNVF